MVLTAGTIWWIGCSTFSVHTYTNTKINSVVVRKDILDTFLDKIGIIGFSIKDKGYY